MLLMEAKPRLVIIACYLEYVHKVFCTVQCVMGLVKGSHQFICTEDKEQSVWVWKKAESIKTDKTWAVCFQTDGIVGVLCCDWVSRHFCCLQILVSERNEQITLVSCFTKDRPHFITLLAGPPFFLLLYTAKIIFFCSVLLSCFPVQISKHS